MNNFQSPFVLLRECGLHAKSYTGTSDMRTIPWLAGLKSTYPVENCAKQGKKWTRAYDILTLVYITTHFTKAFCKCYSNSQHNSNQKYFKMFVTDLKSHYFYQCLCCWWTTLAYTIVYKGLINISSQIFLNIHTQLKKSTIQACHLITYGLCLRLQHVVYCINDIVMIKHYLMLPIIFATADLTISSVPPTTWILFCLDV